MAWSRSSDVRHEFKEIRWDNSVNSLSVSVMFDTERWRVWLFDVFDDQGEELRSAGFRTRLQAIDFAKKFMKKEGK